MRKLVYGLIAGWMLLLVITTYAVSSLGSDAAILFVTDMTHPWRAQFNIDFTFHLVLFACWVWWREKNKVLGSLWAFCCVMGGLFTALYLLLAIALSRGDKQKFFFGANAKA